VSSNWSPESREQETAIRRLAEAAGGVLVRRRSDGAADVLAVEGGISNRYVVRPDGSLELVESRPRDWRRPAEYVFGWASMIFIVVVPFVVIGGGGDDFFAALAVFTGVVLLGATFAVAPTPYRLMRGDERRSDWNQVGFPQE
jgi:hypothetical protein